MCELTIFGYAEEGKVFSETYSVFLEKLPKLNDTLNKVFIRIFDSRGPADSVVYYLGRLGVEDFREILLLCQNGCGIGGLKLLRGFYERAVTMAYISKNPSETEVFIGYDPIHVHKALNHAKDAGFDITKYMSENEIENIERQFETVKDNYQQELCKNCKTTHLQQSWSRLDIGSMAKKIDDALGRYYRMCYYEPTLHGHATFSSIKKRLVRKEDGTGDAIFDESSQRKMVPITLSHTHALMLFNLAVQNEFFDLKLDEELKALLDDFTACWENVTKN